MTYALPLTGQCGRRATLYTAANIAVNASIMLARAGFCSKVVWNHQGIGIIQGVLKLLPVEMHYNIFMTDMKCPSAHYKNSIE